LFSFSYNIVLVKAYVVFGVIGMLNNGRFSNAIMGGVNDIVFSSFMV